MSFEDGLPPEFDPGYYRSLHSDLSAFDDEKLSRHFIDHGANEGRIASVASRRDGFIEKVVAREQGRLLEIGPCDRPIITGRNVRYLDIYTTEQLRGRAPASDADRGAVPRIHYVGQLDAAPRSFDAAVACRSIGHHPDLIRHLQSISRALIDRGRYYMIVPDHRYTGAADLPPASVASVLEAHRTGRERHTLESLVAQRGLRRDEDVVATWVGGSAPLPFEDRARRIETAIDEYDHARGYIDVEAWHFTPESFRDLFAMLCRLGLSSFVPIRVWSTPQFGDEFCAVLEKQI